MGLRVPRRVGAADGSWGVAVGAAGRWQPLARRWAECRAKRWAERWVKRRARRRAGGPSVGHSGWRNGGRIGVRSGCQGRLGGRSPPSAVRRGQPGAAVRAPPLPAAEMLPAQQQAMLQQLQQQAPVGARVGHSGLGRLRDVAPTWSSSVKVESPAFGSSSATRRSTSLRSLSIPAKHAQRLGSFGQR